MMVPTKIMIESGKMLTATAPNDTKRIVKICADVLAEAVEGIVDKAPDRKGVHSAIAEKRGAGLSNGEVLLVDQVLEVLGG